MNYELKSIQPGSVFGNAIRIFVVIGFIVAILSFFILPNPNIRITLWWQKILATILFTVVYTLVSNQQQQSQQFLYGGPTQ